MKQRIAALEARRRVLLEQIAVQREDLAWHADQLRPKAQVAHWSRGIPLSALNHPLAWVTGIVSVAMMLKPRRMLGWLPLLAGGLSIVTRLAPFVRVLSELVRALRSRPR